MASLKEIKSRIQSVKSTQKITSAMKMVSSAKLRKAQKTIENFFPYEQRLNGLLNNFLSAEEDNVSVFAENREVKRVAIIAISSNSSLCGSFNTNVIKKLNHAVENYKSLGKENILIFPVGKKIAKACIKSGFEPEGDFEKMADKPTYAAAYFNRAIAYSMKKEFDKAWEDVHKAENLKYRVNPKFLDDLREASGRDK